MNIFAKCKCYFTMRKKMQTVDEVFEYKNIMRNVKNVILLYEGEKYHRYKKNNIKSILNESAGCNYS